MHRRLLAIGLTILAFSVLIGCTTNPVTGRKSFMLLSWQDEIALGAEAAPQFTSQFGGQVGTPRANDYVSRVGMSLTKVVEPSVPPLEWEFTLLDSDVINAFALPGGKVFITRGLAEKLDNEAQLAGVLGHEIGHVTARHGNQRISKQMGFNLIMTGAAIAVGTADDNSDFRKYGQIAVPALAIGGNVVMLKYGREEELEADMLGMRYMSRAKYNPRGQLQVMQILERESKGSKPPELLSTHPYPETRIKRIRQMLQADYAFTQGNPDYGFYEQRYHKQFLSVLKKQAALDPAGGTFAIGPEVWCAHCRSGEH